jgi:hypothetical protein
MIGLSQWSLILMILVSIIIVLHHLMKIAIDIALAKTVLMPDHLLSKYCNYDLRELIEKLCEDYYEVVDILCTKAYLHVVELQQKETHESILLYTELCKKIIKSISEISGSRREVLAPYLKDLYVKEIEGHNCQECAGGCTVKHKTNLLLIQDSHLKIKKLLDQLRNGLSPGPQVLFPLAYRVFSNELTLIDSMLTELLYLEEIALLPKVKEAQSKIHA